MTFDNSCTAVPGKQMFGGENMFKLVRFCSDHTCRNQNETAEGMLQRLM